MIYKLEMTEKEAALLVDLLTNKAKQNLMWEAATGNTSRREVYEGVLNLLKNIHTEKEPERWQRSGIPSQRG